MHSKINLLLYYINIKIISYVQEKMKKLTQDLISKKLQNHKILNTGLRFIYLQKFRLLKTIGKIKRNNYIFKKILLIIKK